MRYLFALIALGAAFLFGAYTVKKETRLYSAMVVIGNWVFEKPAEFNFYRQYVLTEGKTEIPCPAQTRNTLVAVAFGQSNAANHLGQRFTASDKVVNFFNGKCYVAADPLLGASGRQGSMWTLLGKKLIESGRFDRVVLVTIGIEKASVQRWAYGDLSDLLEETLASMGGYKPTHFLWHQGEADAGRLSADDYALALRKVISATSKAFPESAFFVSTATACRGFNGTDQNIQRGQARVVSGNVHAGPNTDALLAAEDRFDSCHFSMTGQAKIAAMWEAAIGSAAKVKTAH